VRLWGGEEACGGASKDRSVDQPRLKVGDQVEMRKPHPCGGTRWTIVRTGADIRMSCSQCGRVVLLPRPRFLRAVRRHLPQGEADPPFADSTGPRRSAPPAA